MILPTSRLILRPWHEDDAEDLYRYASDPAVGPWAGWPPHTSVENSRGIICSILKHPTVFAVCRKDNRPIGNIHLDFGSALCERDDECELGFWLGKPFWGQGLIPEAAYELLRYAFEESGVQTVRCGYYDGNEKSRRVQEKLGFVRYRTDTVPDTSGQSRIVHRTLLTREMWETQK